MIARFADGRAGGAADRPMIARKVPGARANAAATRP